MKMIRGGGVALAMGALLAFGGCAPVTLAGPGLSLGLNLGSRPGMSLAPTSCALLGGHPSARYLNAAALAGERTLQIQQIQSRFNLASSDVRATQARWRSVVERGC